ncbi:hypothetical protein DLH72_04630, partial [Candidatus Gracilibacteria bacterium]
HILDDGVLFFYFKGLEDLYEARVANQFFEDEWGEGDNGGNLTFAGTYYKLREFNVKKGENFVPKNYKYGKYLEHPENPETGPITEQKRQEMIEGFLNKLKLSSSQNFNRSDFSEELNGPEKTKIYISSNEYYILFEGQNGLEKVDSVDTNTTGTYYLLPYPKKFVRDALNSFEIEGKLINDDVIRNNHIIDVNSYNPKAENIIFENDYFQDKNWTYSQEKGFCEVVKQGLKGTYPSEFPCKLGFKGFKVNVWDPSSGNQKPKINLIGRFGNEYEEDLIVEEYNLGETIKDEAIWRDREDGRGIIPHVNKYKKQGDNYILHNG